MALIRFTRSMIAMVFYVLITSNEKDIKMKTVMIFLLALTSLGGFAREEINLKKVNCFTVNQEANERKITISFKNNDTALVSIIKLRENYQRDIEIPVKIETISRYVGIEYVIRFDQNAENEFLLSTGLFSKNHASINNLVLRYVETQYFSYDLHVDSDRGKLLYSDRLICTIK